MDGTTFSHLKLPCCLDVPAPFVKKAQYAVRMLLWPLGIDPFWVPRSALSERALYYGGASVHSFSGTVVHFPFQAGTAAYFEKAVPYSPSDVTWLDWKGEKWPALFGAGKPAEGDLIASAFFWLSGWQEHAVVIRDRHGRFPHGASLQHVLDTTVRPSVDAYREILAERLHACGIAAPRRTWGGRRWAFCPTHDVDYLRKWRPGPIYRELAQYAVGNQRRVTRAARMRRLHRFLADWLRRGDAYREALHRMQAEVQRRGGKATYFIKTGATDAHDVAYRYDGAFLRRRLAALERDGFEIGLHPSYHAHAHEAYLRAEKMRLAAVTHQPPTSVRQHYLRFVAPATPRLQEALGFKIDSTLGFADHEGFRNATCLPFQLYDIAADRALDLWEMPLSLMEATLFNRRMFEPERAQEVTQTLLRTCARFGGVCVGLWHNTLWDELDSPGWGAHFVQALDAAQAGGALVTSLREALRCWQQDPVEESRAPAR